MNTTKNQVKKLICLFLGIYFMATSYGIAQVPGNAIYGTNSNPHYNNNKNNNATSQNGKTFVFSADVVYHATANKYVAILGVIQEGKSIKECSNAIEKRIANFNQALQQLGVPKTSITTDPITQNRIYEYQLEKESNIAVEKLIGFEIKKNIIISYSNSKMLDKIMLAASEEDIYDLIKVDYIVDNPEKIYATLYEEALKVIEEKKGIYLQLSEKKHFGDPEIIRFEKDMILPLQGYKSYTAHETNEITTNNYYVNKNFKTINARRTATHYFEAAPRGNFDKIINEQQLEPCVQFIFRLQLRFEAI